VSERNAVVVGAGIGGLAVAAGLCRSGWQVTVLEQAPQLSAAGAGITLAPNAVRALDWLGAGAALRERSVASGAAGLRADHGRWLLRTTVDQLTARQGLPVYALHRSDLHQMLFDAANAADVRVGHCVIGVTSGVAPAEVSYVADRRSGTLRADLVVAGDGVHSSTRRALFPEHPGPAYAGYLTWRGVTQPDAAPAELPAVTESWGRGKRFGIVPLADGRTYWFAALAGPEGAHTDDDIDAVAAQFANWHEPIPALLAATPTEKLLRHDIFHLATPLARYATGNVALIGDAAHAMTPDLGQGACQALEDAVVLTARAADGADVSVALAEYDRERRGRTQALVHASARVARLANTASPALALLRDLVAGVLPAAVFLRATDEAFSWWPPASPGPARTNSARRW
jgi:2-polyprenyl-6-methoxyphenol hydroxylase-like FAD-dependent oxidoreductase